MGLLQRAAETYDNMSHLAGVHQGGKTVLAPVGFNTVTAKIEITINGDGNFKRANLIEEKIIIPVTEKSAGRSGKIIEGKNSKGESADKTNPLCEQLEYITGTDHEKYSLYIKQLEKWCVSEYRDEKAIAVLNYVKKRTVLEDLCKDGIIKLQQSEKSNYDKFKSFYVAWRVWDCGEPDAVWKDPALIEHYQNYYYSFISGRKKDVCYVSGKYDIVANQHLKGILPIYSNAKLISANDKQNFTYLGRFLSDKETCGVSFEVSQKAHNALKWLISSNGVIEGDRAFICWNPHGKKVQTMLSSYYSHKDEVAHLTNYRNVLKRLIEGFRSQFLSNDRIIVASFDATNKNSGRLSVTYYNEFGAYDFFDRMKQWDETCCFAYSSAKVSSPYLKTIIEVAFGTQRGEGENAKLEVDKKFSSVQLQRLVACRLECTSFPTDIMRAAVQKCENLNILTKSNRDKVLFTTFAIIKKYRFDHFKEEWDMALEKERKDRSYQYGRLLAVLEKIEISTYDYDTQRETNAIRLQSMFIKRPGYTSAIIQERLKTGYYHKLKKPQQKVYFEKLIGEIIEMISLCGEEDFNKPLGETYLLGYYLQKNAFYTKKTDEEAEENSEN